MMVVSWPLYKYIACSAVPAHRLPAGTSADHHLKELIGWKGRLPPELQAPSARRPGRTWASGAHQESGLGILIWVSAKERGGGEGGGVTGGCGVHAA